MAIVIAIGVLMQYRLFPNGFLPDVVAVNAVTQIVSSRDVCFSEVMTSNRSAINDENGLFPDWIELTNTGTQSADITGWSLSDKTGRSVVFSFPQYVLEPGEFVIVYASGRLQNQEGAMFHAPFKLSAQGDALLLTDRNGTVVEAINLPALGANQSYARLSSGEWVVTGAYTPGMANTADNHTLFTALEPTAGSPLVISEIMADNASHARSADGNHYDWIELHNASQAVINLSGYGLSDKPGSPLRWRFPDVDIAPGAYLLVYASAREGGVEGELHANFHLRAEGEAVLLYDAAGRLLDYVAYDNLKTDQSYARMGDGSFAKSHNPTPGAAN